MINKNPIDLKKRIVLLTGGLGKLGFITSKEIIKNNGKLIILDINTPSNSQSRFIKDNNISFFKIDLTNYEALLNLSKEKIFKNIYSIINNAAIDTPPSNTLKLKKFFDIDIKLIDKEIFDNIKMYLYVSKVFGKFLYLNKKGNILNISSIYGSLSPDQSIYKNSNMNFEKPISYSISKSSIYGFTKYLAHYYSDRSVRVNTLILSGILGNQNKKFIKLFSKKTPLRRMMYLSEAAQAINFAISDYSSYINGSNILIDGGYSTL